MKEALRKVDHYGGATSHHSGMRNIGAGAEFGINTHHHALYNRKTIRQEDADSSSMPSGMASTILMQALRLGRNLQGVKLTSYASPCELQFTFPRELIRK